MSMMRSAVSVRSSKSTLVRGIPRAGIVRLMNWGVIAMFVMGCGHVGVDLGAGEDDVSDASRLIDDDVDNDGLDASRVVDDDDAPTDDDKPSPGDDAAVPERPVRDAGDFPPSEDASVVKPGSDAGAYDAGNRPTAEEGGIEPRPNDRGDAGDVADGGTPPSEGGDAGGPEPERIECNPECECLEGSTCELECIASPCWATCAAGSVCNVTSGEAAEVGISCGEGAVCTTGASLDESVHFTCEGPGDCQVSCGVAEECGLDCVGTGKCFLDCAQAAACNVECATTSRCFVERGSNGVDVVFECREDGVAECGATLLACRSDCPDNTAD